MTNDWGLFGGLSLEGSRVRENWCPNGARDIVERSDCSDRCPSCTWAGIILKIGIGFSDWWLSKKWNKLTWTPTPRATNLGSPEGTAKAVWPAGKSIVAPLKLHPVAIARGPPGLAAAEVVLDLMGPPGLTLAENSQDTGQYCLDGWIRVNNILGGTGAVETKGDARRTKMRAAEAIILEEYQLKGKEELFRMDASSVWWNRLGSERWSTRMSAVLASSYWGSRWRKTQGAWGRIL